MTGILGELLQLLPRFMLRPQTRLAVKGKVDTVGFCLQVLPNVLSRVALVLNDKNVHRLVLSQPPLYQQGIRAAYGDCSETFSAT